MHVTRRLFTRGLTASAGTALVRPRLPKIAARAPDHSDDAYELLLSRYIEIEEQARIQMPATFDACDGPMTATGREIEDFLGELDLRVEIRQSAMDLVRELKGRLARSVDKPGSQAERLEPTGRSPQPRRSAPHTLSYDTPDPDASISDTSTRDNAAQVPMASEFGPSEPRMSGPRQSGLGLSESGRSGPGLSEARPSGSASECARIAPHETTTVATNAEITELPTETELTGNL